MALIRRSAASLAALADQGSVAEVMFEQMLHGLGVRPSPGETRSWECSIPVLAHDLVQAGLGGVEVLLEHRLPLRSRRVDAILAGAHPSTGDPSYVVVELKQWSDADLYEDDPALVTVNGYGHRPRLHPLDQVRAAGGPIAWAAPWLRVWAGGGEAYCWSTRGLVRTWSANCIARQDP